MRILRSLAAWLLALVALALRRPRRARRQPSSEETIAVTPPRPRAEAPVLACLALASAAFVGFIVAYAAAAANEVLGLTLGLGLAGLAAAAAIAGKALVVQEQVVEPRPERSRPEVVEEAAERLTEGSEPLTRRRLLVAAAGTTALAGAAFATPLASLGPSVGDKLEQGPWRRGRLLVDDRGRPVRAAELEVGSFTTAFPAGANREWLASPVVVVRIRADELRLPRGRSGWAPDGILAFSKICTHAGCAIALFRYPVYQPTSSGPALVCPCHYSTFDVTRGALPVFGPAVRSLPQLPLSIDAAGRLVAAGPMSGQVGPSWLEVNRT